MMSLALLAALALPRLPAAREFRIEASHSLVGFSIPFLGTRVRGQFDDVEGMLSYDPANMSHSGVTVRMRVASLHTGSTHRDGHLVSSDFFDVERHPWISFQSDTVRCVKRVCTMAGPLSMHGVTRRVSFRFTETHAPTVDPHGGTLVNFTAATRIARKDFGILGGSKYNDWFDELRSRTMGDTVDIDLEIAGFATDFERTTANDAALAKVAQGGVAPIVERLRGLKAHRDSLGGVLWQAEQLSLTLISRGKADQGLTLLRAASDVLPDTAPSFALLARGFEMAGLRDSAVATAKRALTARPGEPRASEVLRRSR
jgi:polyisoprenoid-binding protein YceI